MTSLEFSSRFLILLIKIDGNASPKCIFLLSTYFKAECRCKFIPSTCIIKSSQTGYLTHDKIQKQKCKCFLHFVDFIAFPLQFWIFQMPAQFDTKCDIIILCQLHTQIPIKKKCHIVYWNFFLQFFFKKFNYELLHLLSKAISSIHHSSSYFLLQTVIDK